MMTYFFFQELVKLKKKNTLKYYVILLQFSFHVPHSILLNWITELREKYFSNKILYLLTSHLSYMTDEKKKIQILFFVFGFPNATVSEFLLAEQF